MTDLDGLIPAELAPRTRKIVLDGFELPVDIGFHAFEIGSPQTLRVTVEVWLDVASFPECDTVERAWDYDSLRSGIIALTSGRRFNLQETVCRAVYDQVAARRGVVGVRVATSKPDVYPDCAAVGVELSSF